MHVTIASISRAKSHLSLSRTTEPERNPEDTTKALLTPTRISSSETFVLRAITLSAALSSSVALALCRVLCLRKGVPNPRLVSVALEHSCGAVRVRKWQ